MNPNNNRTVLALRELADRMAQSDALPVGASINHALSHIEGKDDAERLLRLLLDGVGINA